MVREFTRPRDYEIGGWLVENAPAIIGRRIAKNDADYLADRVGYDLDLLNSELQKIDLTLPPGKLIDRAAIDSATGGYREMAPFELAAALGAQDLPSAIRIIDSLFSVNVYMPIVVAALARPIVSMGWIGSSGPRDLILVLDNSMSTARKIGSGTVFDQELDQAAKLIRQLRDADLVRVLLASPAPEWLTDSPQAADPAGQEALISRLRQLSPNQGAADIPKALQTAIKGQPAGQEVTRFVTLITDGQAHGWRADAAAEWASIFTLSQRARPPVLLRAVLAAADSGPASNLAVAKLAAARAVAAVGQPVALTATVKNTGALKSEAGSLAWSAGGQSIGLSAVPALDAGAETTVTLSQPFANPGVVDISCQLSGQDDLSLDDSARFLLNITESAPILVVEGESHFDPLQSDSAYLLSALGWQAGGDSALDRRSNTRNMGKGRCISAKEMGKTPRLRYNSLASV
jgi:hypothetical protein